MDASKRLREKASMDDTQGTKRVRPSEQADSSYEEDLGNAANSRRLSVQQQALSASNTSKAIDLQQVTAEPTSSAIAEEEHTWQPHMQVSSEIQAAYDADSGPNAKTASQKPISSTRTAAAKSTIDKAADEEVSTRTAAAEPTAGKAADMDGSNKASPKEPEPSASTAPVELSMDACVMGLPGNWSQPRLIAYLEALKVEFDLLRKKKGWTYAFIRFSTPEQRAGCQAVLQQQNLGCGKLAVKNSKPAKSNKGYGKSAHGAGADLAAMDVRSVVCPLWQLPYGEQLLRKRERVEEALKRVTRQVAKRHKRSSDGPTWLKELPDKDATCAPLLGILRSPQLDGYRNKCEFSIGVGVDDQPVVGFALGSFKDGITAMAPPTGCRHISPTAVRLAAKVQEFLRLHSQLPVWDKRVNQGFWRQLTVREGREKAFIPCTGQQGRLHTQSSFAELDWQQWLVPVASGTAAAGIEKQAVDAPVADHVMVVVQINPEAASAAAAEAECAALGAFLRQCCKEGPQPLPPSVMLLQQHSGVSNAAPEDAPLLPFPQFSQDINLADKDKLADKEGEAQRQGVKRAGLPVATHIHDSLGDLRFQISPAAFFQVNSGAASVLFKAAGEWAAPEPNSVLLDICCGTGIIGLTLAHKVASVVGVDIVEQAIADARTNAALNGITNCHYIAGRAEDVLHRLLAPASQSSAAQPASNKHSSVAQPASDGHDGSTARPALSGHDGSVAQPESNRHGSVAQPASGIIRSQPEEMIPAENGDSVPQPLSGISPNQPVEITPAGTGCTEGPSQPAGTDSQECRKVGEEGEPAEIIPAGNGGTEGASPHAGTNSQECGRAGREGEPWIAPGQSVVAIVDPPRAGLHDKVLRALLRCPAVSRLVYVSCNPDTLANDLVELCSPPVGTRGTSGIGWLPFRPIKALAADLFPHTNHVESLVLLQR